MSREFPFARRSLRHIESEVMAATPFASAASLAAIDDVLRSGRQVRRFGGPRRSRCSAIEPHMTGIGGDCFSLIAESLQSRCGATTVAAARAPSLDRSIACQGHDQSIERPRRTP